MTWTKKNALNRWCLRTLQQNCASPLHNLLHEAAGLAVRIVAGETDNLKITVAADIALAERILAWRSESA